MPGVQGKFTRSRERASCGRASQERFFDGNGKPPGVSHRSRRTAFSSWSSPGLSIAARKAGSTRTARWPEHISLRKSALRSIVLPVTGITLHSIRLNTRPRFALLMLCLLACTAQTFVAQTHVHNGGGCTEWTSVAPDCVPGGEAGKHKGNELACPLCQVAMHGAALPLAPSAITVALADQDFLAAVSEPLPSSIAAISYHWRSRGPPSS
jgi:hypothetical protein